MKNNSRYKIAIFGAQPDTPNMGVSALFYSLTLNLFEKFNGNVDFIVFDNGIGSRIESISTNNETIKITRLGARAGHRYYRPENLFSILILSCLGRLGSMLNKRLTLLDQCDAVIDVSGGDSFSDIYGLKRFKSVLWPKIITINRKIPLILAPQTYGPYRSSKVKLSASCAVKAADMCWARDQDSFLILKELLGSNFDSNAHKCGVDMAFKLPITNSSAFLSTELNNWISQRDVSPLVGINVSGLIYLDPDATKKRFNFKANYQQTIHLLVNQLLEDSNCKIVLISHVMDVHGHYESDSDACKQVIKHLKPEFHSRVIISPSSLNQSQVKWLISQMSWFCGTRMHATIAGLSSGVPTASISYSDKTLGVFKTCGQETHVFDPRKLDDLDIVNKAVVSYSVREETRASLKQKLIPVLLQADAQITNIAEFISKNCSR